MNEITVKSSARIHSALINESGFSGRIDGGIGFSIDSPSWEIVVSRNEINSPNDSSHLNKELLDALESTKQKIQDQYQLPNIHYKISDGIESHIGLGSKTALLMGFSKAVSRLFNLDISHLEMAIIAGRGGTSGIGYWASQTGGFLWDAGRSYPEEKSCFSPSSASNNKPPKLIVSIDLDEYYICHFRFSDKGLSGKKEELLFKRYCPVPHIDTKEILALVSGSLVPSFLDKDCSNIQKTLNRLQMLGFKSVEWDQQDKATKRFRDYWNSRMEETALCLSSMGPTMYCLTMRPESVREIVETYHTTPTHFQVSKILNGRIE